MNIPNSILVKALTQPLMKSKFNINYTYTNIETKLEILLILPKCPKLNTTEQFEVYKIPYQHTK